MGLAGYTEVHAQLRANTATAVDASRLTEPIVQTHTPLGACGIAQMLSGQAKVVDPHNVLSVKHWDRIGQGRCMLAPINEELIIQNAEMQNAEMQRL